MFLLENHPLAAGQSNDTTILPELDNAPDVNIILH